MTRECKQQQDDSLSFPNTPVHQADGSLMLDHRGRAVYRNHFLSTHPLRSECEERIVNGKSTISVSSVAMIGTMNLVFGNGGWGTSLSMQKEMHCEMDGNGRWVVGYIAIVKISLKDGVSYEDCGSGEAVDSNKTVAHENAMKIAISEATIHAARHFGERLGNALSVKSNHSNTLPVDNREAFGQLEIILRTNNKNSVQASATSAAEVISNSVPNRSPIRSQPHQPEFKSILQTNNASTGGGNKQSGHYISKGAFKNVLGSFNISSKISNTVASAANPQYLFQSKTKNTSFLLENNDETFKQYQNLHQYLPQPSTRICHFTYPNNNNLQEQNDISNATTPEHSKRISRDVTVSTSNKSSDHGTCEESTTSSTTTKSESSLRIYSENKNYHENDDYGDDSVMGEVSVFWRHENDDDETSKPVRNFSNEDLKSLTTSARSIPESIAEEIEPVEENESIPVSISTKYMFSKTDSNSELQKRIRNDTSPEYDRSIRGNRPTSSNSVVSILSTGSGGSRGRSWRDGAMSRFLSKSNLETENMLEG